MNPKTLLPLVGLLLVTTWASAQTFRWNDGKTKQQTRSNDRVTAKSGDVYNPHNQLANSEVQIGEAQYYADYYEGNSTALGEIYRADQLTGSHASYPLGTLLKVTRLDNGMSVTVRINDRSTEGSVPTIDVSKSAARIIDLVRSGRTRVRMEVVGYSDRNPTPPPAAREQLVARGGTATSSTYAPAATTAPTDYRETVTARTPVAKAPVRQVSAYTPPPAPVASPDEVNIITNNVRGYAIQMGSYGEFTNARRHVQNLQQKGMTNVYVKQDVRADGMQLNRVIIGPYPTMADAEYALQTIGSDGLVVKL